MVEQTRFNYCRCLESGKLSINLKNANLKTFVLSVRIRTILGYQRSRGTARLLRRLLSVKVSRRKPFASEGQEANLLYLAVGIQHLKHRPKKHRLKKHRLRNIALETVGLGTVGLETVGLGTVVLPNDD